MRVISATKIQRTTGAAVQLTRTITTPEGLVRVRNVNAVSRVQPLPANVTRTLAVSAVTGGAAGAPVWGGISGTLADQIDLINALNAKAAAAHTHAIGEVSGLQAALDSKAAAGAFAALVHGHAIVDVTGLQAALDAKAASGHTHAQAEVTGLVAALAGKEPVIAAGTAAQYLKGDKTLGTLDKVAVGLGNVDNTSDASKPVSTATATALAAKSDTSHGHANVVAAGAAGFMTGADKTKLD
ncbi:MAG: hypothetical protein ACRCU5_13785, partial [Rhizobiaceae bacterium]